MCHVKLVLSTAVTVTRFLLRQLWWLGVGHLICDPIDSEVTKRLDSKQFCQILYMSSLLRHMIIIASGFVFYLCPRMVKRTMMLKLFYFLIEGLNYPYF